MPENAHGGSRPTDLDEAIARATAAGLTGPGAAGDPSQRGVGGPRGGTGPGARGMPIVAPAGQSENVKVFIQVHKSDEPPQQECHRLTLT